MVKNISLYSIASSIAVTLPNIFLLRDFINLPEITIYESYKK